MENLKKVINLLKENRGNFKGDYYIPKCWDTIGFSGSESSSDRPGEVSVNPYEFMSRVIESEIIGKNERDNELPALGVENENAFPDLQTSVLYSMLPRMFSAWNHIGEELESGTFLKTICLLPYLKKLNVNIIYLLPVFKYSDRNKKGEIGSPYAIKNAYELDKNLHDNLLGEESGIIDVEFKAFIEACHALGIYVMVDFVFRTVARDHDLIVDHPEWFYWIKKEKEQMFKAPYIETVKSLTCVNDRHINKLYTAKSMNEYLNQFVEAPSIIDNDKWNNLLDKYKRTGENILKLIEDEFNITTTPGFSDVINDPQPAWSDVTYIKLYSDLHRKARKYIKEGQPHYVLQDIAKSNLFPADQKNIELWDYLVNIIPYYQNNFGIDGARIDMGHALPNELNKAIIEKVRSYNKNFILWSEEFNAKNSGHARDDGFHFMTGYLWATYKKVEKGGFYNLLTKDVKISGIPLSAALETADTPRAALVYRDRKSMGLMVVLNSLVPNAVPVINNGLDVMEVQPMNLGLDNTEEGRFVLDKNDSMYGKLAFFDNYKLHWTNENQEWMFDRLAQANGIRKRYAKFIKLENFLFLPDKNKSKKLILILYYDKEEKEGLFLLANRSKQEKANARLLKLIPAELGEMNSMYLAYQNGEKVEKEEDIHKDFVLQPKDWIVGTIK